MHFTETLRGFRRAGLGFRGVVVLNGIFGSSEMARWWRSLEVGGARKIDVTPLGHGDEGTGILDFSGRIRVVTQPAQQQPDGS